MKFYSIEIIYFIYIYIHKEVVHVQKDQRKDRPSRPYLKVTCHSWSFKSSIIFSRMLYISYSRDISKDKIVAYRSFISGCLVFHTVIPNRKNHRHLSHNTASILMRKMDGTSVMSDRAIAL